MYSSEVAPGVVKAMLGLEAYLAQSGLERSDWAQRIVYPRSVIAPLGAITACQQHELPSGKS